MPEQEAKIQTPGWAALREFLTPRRGRSGYPSHIGEMLQVTIESEKWLTLPTFTNTWDKTLIALVFSAIQITTGNFAITGFRVRMNQASTNLMRIVTAPNLTPVLALAAQIRTADSYSGVPSLLVQESATAAALPSGIELTTTIASNEWTELPDLGPNQVLQFVGGTVNQTLRVEAAWTERRTL